MKVLWLLICFWAVIQLSSCSPDTPQPSGEDLEEARMRVYLDSGFTEGENGIYYKQITLNPSGGRVPEDGDVLSIHYVLWELGDNIEKQITSVTDSTGSDSLILLKQGSNAIYPVGLDLALDTMREGEMWEFILPSAMAYGDLSLTNIPANAIIKARIRLLQIRGEAEVHQQEIEEIQNYGETHLQDTINPPRYLAQGLGMAFKSTRSGSGLVMAKSGDTVVISYTIKTMDGDPVASIGAADPSTFILDQKPGPFLGLAVGIKQMAAGGEAILVIPSSAAYQSSVAVIPYSILDPNVAGSVEENPLIINLIIPPYAAYVRPYETLLVEIQLLGVNN